ncbi:MAG: TIR domain-containing protein [Syntrophobacterales bacterium]
MTYEYEFALSFAGEDREFADYIAKGLKEKGIKVFYDNFFSHELWGEDLSLKLREIYYAKSRYCILIISESYIQKMWPNFERQQAIERLIEQRGSTYILPVRLDGFGGDVPGLSKNISFISVSSKNPEMVVNTFLKKIGKIKEENINISETEKTFTTFTPKLKKSFTDKDKNQFLRNSFEMIVGLIEESLKKTNKEYPQLEFDFDRVSTRKSIFTIYDSGNELTRFKLWISGSIGSDSIRFSYGRVIEDDNSYNESFSIEENDVELKLKPLGMLSHGSDRDKSMSPEEVNEYLLKIIWERFQ